MVRETTIAFTGDIGFDKYMHRRWNDAKLVSDEVLAFLRSADHLVINVEGPLTRRRKAPGVTGAAANLRHSIHPNATKFFDRIGADVWNICNNHIMDAGAVGIEDTLAEAARCKVKTLGAGRNIAEASSPLVIKEAGGIGMIGVGYQRACRKAGDETPGCFSWSDMDRIRKAITAVKKRCRWCVVVAHGGEEFTALPSPYTRDRYHEYLAMGADIVVSHHPHVPMNYETVGDKAIFYSLGNFIFDTDYQRAQFNTEYGLFVKLHFTENEWSFEPFGIRIDRTHERIVKADLPRIFADVQPEEYELLAPLAAKVFIANTKRQLTFLYPEKFADATEEDWVANFYEPLRSGRVPGEVLDMQIVYPLAQREAEKAWERSSLEDVKQFMLEQLE